MEFNSKIVSLLEKIEKPIGQVKSKFEVAGVFCVPEELENVEQNNQGLFKYSVGVGVFSVQEAKFYPRQLTEEEKNAIEEAKKNKGKKKEENQENVAEQKPVKKQNIPKDPKLLEEYLYKQKEDPYKGNSFKFSQNYMEKEIIDTELVIFEERVYDDKGDWIFFIREPQGTPDDLAKLRKNKPKNCSSGDLYPIIFKGWFDFREFQIPGYKRVEKRIKVKQEKDSEDYETADYDAQEMYIKVSITLDQAITPIVNEIQPTIKDILPHIPEIQKPPKSEEAVNFYRSELQVIIESLSMEYINLFNKDLYQSDKHKHALTTQKISDINKRKDQFLYDFNISGKYKILKEKIKKSIVLICKDKFEKEGSFNGVTTDQRDQFYSELYVFLVEQMRITLQSMVFQKREEMHEDIILSHDQTLKERNQLIQNLNNETQSESYYKYALEYEIINKMSLSEKNIKKLIALDTLNCQNWLFYSKFCLKTKNFSKAEEAVSKALSIDSTNKDIQILMACLYIRRSRCKEALLILQEQLKDDLTNNLLNLLIAFVYSAFLKEERTGKKYQNIANRVYMRNNGMLPPKATHYDSPSPFELPNFKTKIYLAQEAAKKIPVLTNDQLDDIWGEMLIYLCENGFLDLLEKALPLLSNKNNTFAKIQEAKISQYFGQYEKAILLIDEILKVDSRNFEALSLKVDICYDGERFYEFEETFFKAMRLKGARKNFSQYLRLGFIYLKRKSWPEAQSVFSKAVEMKNNSPLSWLGLGVSSLRLGQLEAAEEALKQANIYEPYNSDVWGHLVLLCLLNDRNEHAFQCLREFFKLEVDTPELLLEISEKLVYCGEFQRAEDVLKQAQFLLEKKDRTQLFPVLKLLGDVMKKQGKNKDAMTIFDYALQCTESESEKKDILKMRRSQIIYQLFPCNKKIGKQNMGLQQIQVNRSIMKLEQKLFSSLLHFLRIISQSLFSFLISIIKDYKGIITERFGVVELNWEYGVV